MCEVIVCRSARLGVERMVPAQARPTTEAAVRGGQLGTGRDRQGGDPRVGDSVTAGASATAEVGEDVPGAPRARHDLTAGVAHDGVHQRYGTVERQGFGENARVGHDADEPGQADVGDGERRRPVHQVLPPRAPGLVALRGLVVGVHEDVDVRQDHRLSIASSSAGESSRSTPGRTPERKAVSYTHLTLPTIYSV